MSNCNKQIVKIAVTFMSILTVVACNNGTAPEPVATTPPPPPSKFCVDNTANFSSVQALSLEASGPVDPEWGPNLATLPFPSDLATCKQEYTTWNQDRVIAAANYWVSQKVNYCHHHVPTWYADTKEALETAACSIEPNAVQASSTYNHIIRWNYSNTGTETELDWYTPGVAPKTYGTGKYGYGLDCSDYTKLMYAYAEGILFSSGINTQAGQSSNQLHMAPNMPGFVDSTAKDPLGLSAAGQLVCADGTLAPRGVTTNGLPGTCHNHGGYISVFGHDGKYRHDAITDVMLGHLKPGDLIYIAGCGSSDGKTGGCAGAIPQQVTHVIVWTGQKIGQSATIPNSAIAPETDTDDYGDKHGECANHDWWTAPNNMGNWIITDSHYQGPDYRAFTNCFYRNQVWGVRRVIGANNS